MTPKFYFATSLLFCLVEPSWSQYLKADETVAYPAQGVLLGSGFDLLEGKPLTNVCLEPGPAVQTDVRADGISTFVRVTDKETLDHAINASANASFAYGTSSASAEYSFEHKVNITRDSLSMVAQITRHSKTIFLGFPIAPVSTPFLGPGTPVSSASNGHSETINRDIRLTSEATKRVIRDEEGFRKECGDGYVSAIHFGGHLLASFQFSNLQSQDYTSISGQLSGTYTVAAGAAKFAETNNLYKSRATVNIFMVPVGGNGPQPISDADFVAYISNFADRVDANPVPYEIQVTPYSRIQGWPEKIKVNDKPIDTMKALVREEALLRDVSNNARSVSMEEEKYLLSGDRSLPLLIDPKVIAQTPTEGEVQIQARDSGQTLDVSASSVNATIDKLEKTVIPSIVAAQNKCIESKWRQCIIPEIFPRDYDILVSLPAEKMSFSADAILAGQIGYENWNVIDSGHFYWRYLHQGRSNYARANVEDYQRRLWPDSRRKINAIIPSWIDQMATDRVNRCIKPKSDFRCSNQLDGCLTPNDVAKMRTEIEKKVAPLVRRVNEEPQGYVFP
jgi:hypothetical protein